MRSGVQNLDGTLLRPLHLLIQRVAIVALEGLNTHPRICQNLLRFDRAHNNPVLAGAGSIGVGPNRGHQD